jgi:hypothetical protein
MPDLSTDFTDRLLIVLLIVLLIGPRSPKRSHSKGL